MPGIITEVVEQHAEEAAFLWLLRNNAVRATNYDLTDLTELDGRIDAHLDGLRIAGDDGWEICKEALRFEEPGEVFAAAHVAYRSNGAQRVDDVLEVACKSVELARGVTSALGWLTYQQATPHVESLIESTDPILRRIGIGAGAVHRLGLRERLTKAVGDQDPIVRSRALRAVGELGRTDLAGQCQDAFVSEDEACKFWSAWSAALLGDSASTTTLWELAAAGGPFADRACDVAARCVSPAQAVEWQKRLAEMESHVRLAVIAARALGDPAVVPWLIQQMDAAALARLAGDAFCSITGVDLHAENLECAPPEDVEAGPTESPEDEDVEMDPDEDLPWPDPILVGQWWSQNQGRFAPGARHLGGYRIATDPLGYLLKKGNQSQRAAAALELVLQQPGQTLFEIRARGDRQQNLLAAAHGLPQASAAPTRRTYKVKTISPTAGG